jgi:hypothetical protein
MKMNRQETMCVAVRSKQSPPSKAHEKGYILITSAASILVLLGFLGLTVDVGYLQFQKRRIQSAADAAAAGAAFQLAAQASHNMARTEGLYDSKKNGFEDAVNGVTVTINIPPTIGNYTTNNYAAEAIVRQANPTYFMNLFNISSVTVAARSVVVATNSSNCIYALDPSAQDAFLVNGGGTVNLNCGIVVDSSDSKALETKGTPTNLIASNISVVGNYNANAGSTISPTPTTGSKVVPDPLAYLTAPTVPGTCDYTNYSLNGGTATINPGTYCNGITAGGTAVVLYLNPGLYILKGGGLSIAGGANIISNAGGVTIDNTSGGGYNYKAIAIAGGSTTSLAAPTTSSGGALEGILFFDRTGTASSKETITGGSGAKFTGALYFPNSEVDFTGGTSGTGDWTIVVANQVKFSGDSALGRDFSNYPDGSPIKQGATIAE